MQKVVGAHIKSVYSINKKSILIKFSTKDQILIEPPSKFHLTYVDHEKINLTPIAIYLRKILNNCRVESIYQLGFDRVAAIRMASATGPMLLIIEMYANGNIILTDQNLCIMNLLRPVEHLGVIKGGTYPLNQPEIEANIERFDYVTGNTLKKKISSFFSLSGRVVDDIQSRMQIYFNKKMNTEVPLTLENISKVREKFPDAFVKYFNEFAQEMFQLLSTVGNYGAVTYEGDRAVSFTPWKELELEKKRRVIVFESFGHTMDASFLAPVIKETAEEKKNRKIVEAQKRSLEDKIREAESLRNRAYFLQSNCEKLEKAAEIIRSAEKEGMSQKEFERYRKEAENVDEIAQMIKKMDFAKKTMTIKKDNQEEIIDYNETIHASTNKLFMQAKKIQEKAEKAKNALEESIKKSKEIEIKKEAQKKKQKEAQSDRHPNWFEKFIWFITKDNDLILAGRDAKQNEVLIKRHMKETDYYFHAEIQGASSIIVGESATEETKQIAAGMAMCLSRAWEKGVISPVFSVLGSQVSKSAPAGEYLSQGSFMITGKKTYYHPYVLEYGIGFIYKQKREENEAEDTDRKIYGFTSTPSKDRKIEYAMPLAGPYKSIEGPKYRLLSGSHKKGMIIKEVLALAEEDVPEENISHIRGISAKEMEMSIIKNSKLAHSEIARRKENSVFNKKRNEKKKQQKKKPEKKKNQRRK